MEGPVDKSGSSKEDTLRLPVNAGDVKNFVVSPMPSGDEEGSMSSKEDPPRPLANAGAVNSVVSPTLLRDEEGSVRSPMMLFGSSPTNNGVERVYISLAKLAVTKSTDRVEAKEAMPEPIEANADVAALPSTPVSKPRDEDESANPAETSLDEIATGSVKVPVAPILLARDCKLPRASEPAVVEPIVIGGVGDGIDIPAKDGTLEARVGDKAVLSSEEDAPLRAREGFTVFSGSAEVGRPRDSDSEPSFVEGLSGMAKSVDSGVAVLRDSRTGNVLVLNTLDSKEDSFPWSLDMRVAEAGNMSPVKSEPVVETDKDTATPADTATAVLTDKLFVIVCDSASAVASGTPPAKVVPDALTSASDKDK